MKKLTTMTTTATAARKATAARVTTAARKATAARVTTAARKATAGVELMTGAALRALAVMTMVMLTTATAWAQKSEYWTDDGTAEKPYKITSEAGLRALSDLSKGTTYSGKYFELGGNITMSDKPMAPIGTSGSGSFNGHFNGQGYTISNLHISGRVDECAGLFAMNEGTISGVTLDGCTVTGNEDGARYTGGIAGLNKGTVSGCHITGSSSVSTTGVSEYLGGIVGYNEGGKVSECTSAATVSATAGNYFQYVGGIVGYNGSGGTVSGCGNTGGVAISGEGSALYECGGIVGFNNGKVSGCINTGEVSSSVSGDNHAGGIAGNANNDASVTIENCANGGAVTASGVTRNCAGGIVGYRSNSSNYVLTNNFYFGACTAKGVANGGGSFDVTDNNGAVEAYAVTAAEGVTVEPAVSMATVKGGDAITSENYFMEGMTVTLGDYTGAAAEGFNGYTATKDGGSVDVSCADGAYSFTMPAEAVTVAPAFMATMTGVSYIDGNGKAATTPEGVNVWVLSGATTGLTHIGKEGETTWYVVTDSNAGGVDAAFKNNVIEGEIPTALGFRGDVHLILADGAEMQVGTADGNNNMIGDEGASLTIYGQTAGTGALSVLGEGVLMARSTENGTDGDLNISGGTVMTSIIGAVDVTISGGTVTTSTITAQDLTISGGTVTMSEAIYTQGGDLTISGGKVTAEGIMAQGGLTISGGQVTVNNISAFEGDFLAGTVTPLPVNIALTRATDYVYAGELGFTFDGKQYSPVNITGKLIAINSDGKYYRLSDEEYDGGDEAFRGTTLRLDVWGMADENDGTAEKPYKITTEAGLRALSDLSKDNDYYGKYFELGGNITMSDEPMAPIGRSSGGEFSGNFNGQGYTISNLHISGKVGVYAGLFARNNGTISGVTLDGCTITGNEAGTRYTGGIAGWNNGMMSGCHITGSSSVSTTGASESLGGIVGYNENTVSGCTSAATVSATASNYGQSVGGIVGYNCSTVSGCGNTGSVDISGTVSSEYYCGGIVGYNYSGTVSGCINTGAVSIGANGYKYAGGIVGGAKNDGSVKIENCANGGAVTATGGTVNCAGGIVGYYYNSQFVLKDNFYFGACKTKGTAGFTSSGDAPQNDVTANNGAVEGYAVTAAEGVTGVTVAPAVSVKTVGGGGTITSENYFMEGMTVKLGDYTGATAEGFNGYTAATAGGGSVEVSCAGGAYSFAMPAEAVTVAPAFLETMTGVSYIDWDGEAMKTPEGVNVWVLSGATTGQASLGKEDETTWYVVTDSNTGGVDAAFTSVSFRGLVNLILADGAEMQVRTADDDYNNMIGDEGAGLFIYGQKAGTGALHVKNLEAGGRLGISGGKVTADEAICAMGGLVEITGGQVTAGKAIYAGDGDMPLPVRITLRSGTDYVKAGSNGFTSGNIASPVNITGTLNAFDSNGTYCGSMRDEELAGDAAIFCGKTLRLDVWGMAQGKDGTKEKPYVITTEEGLRALSELSKDNSYGGKYFELGGNIKMSDEPMAPIGTRDDNEEFNGYFSGNFNGQGYTISNLHISGNVGGCAGLFALNWGTISGVTLDGCTITGNEAGTLYTGGIAGRNKNTVSGCHITGSSSVSSTGASSILGGIVGYNENTVSGCTSAATVSATAGNYGHSVGGIVGYNCSTVSDCGNTGGVAISGTGSSGYECGGIVGWFYSGTVSGCINTGTVSSSVSGSNYAGGIVGNAKRNAGISVTIENCANGGAVTATGGTTNFAGGIVGYRPNNSNYVLTNNFYFGACTAKGVANEDGSFDITDNNGAVAGYAVTAAEGVTVVPAVSMATVVGGEVITSDNYFMEGMTVTLGDYSGTVPEGKGLYGYTAATAGDGSVEVSFADGAYSFAMPAEAVTVAPDFWECMTEVSFIYGYGEAITTPEGEPVWVLSGETTGLTHIGKEDEVTWYVVTESNKGGVDAAFTSVSFRGIVCLILADGAAMKVGNADGGGSMTGEVGASLAVFGQTAGTGALHVNDLGASCDAEGAGGGLDINGGKVTADKAIRAEGWMNIRGGQVTAGLGIYAGDENMPGTVKISMRRATDYVYAGENGFAGKGTTDISTVQILDELFSINGDGSYYDRVSAGNYVAGNNEAFKGKTLRAAKYADTNKTVAWYISDREHNDVVRLKNVPAEVPTLTNKAKKELRSLYEAGQIRGVTVDEAKEAAVRTTWTELSDMVYADRLTLFAPGATNTWGTFCADGDYRLPEGCTAYTLSGIGSGTVTVTPLMDGEQLATTVPACVPVMIHRTADVPDGGLTASFEAAVKVDEDHGWTFSEGMGYNKENYCGYVNVVYSKDETMLGLAQGIYVDTEAEEGCYLVGNSGAKGTAIKNCINELEGETDYALYNDRLIRIEGDPGISRHRCVLTLPGGDDSGDDGGKSRQLSIVIADGEPTAIDAAPATGADAAPGATGWYTLDGRKVEGRPTKKGVYISGGRKVVVK